MTEGGISANVNWTRGGLVLQRRVNGDGKDVIGDPCIVRDPEIGGWRMFLFFSPPGHGQAICRNLNNPGPGQWELLGPLKFTNPEATLGGLTHKPYIVQDANIPNQAARINGQYCLLSVSYVERHKIIQRAFSPSLAGPWCWEAQPLIRIGASHEFDGKHCDAVTAIHFSKRNETLIFYMGYPVQAQPRTISPYGNAQAVARVKDGETTAEKLGVILPPMQEEGHWASGWVGGLQVLPGREHRWIGLANASPTPPRMGDHAITAEEPAPSLAGFAYCDEEYPITGWQWCPQPLEWVEKLPPEATSIGEGVNMWRQNLIVLPDKRYALYYNSGSYGQEQLYMQWGTPIHR